MSTSDVSIIASSEGSNDPMDQDLGEDAAYKPMCVRKSSNWSRILPAHKFDKKTFVPDKIIEDMLEASPKLVKLLDKIHKQDARDMRAHGRLFKHFIFSDVRAAGYGAKIIASALIASGMKLAYNQRLKMSTDQELQETRGNNLALLCSTAVYNQGISAKLKKQILTRYNARPDNVHGDNIRFIVMDAGFKEGIDLFDVKYVHIFEPPISTADKRQAIGRATRTCGQKGLEFHPSQGWKLHVSIYDVSVPERLREELDDAETLFDMFLANSPINMDKMRFAEVLEAKAIHGSVDYELNQNIHKFKVEDLGEDDEELMEGGREGWTGGAKDTVDCAGRCGERKPTKWVPVQIPLMATVFLAQGRTFPPQAMFDKGDNLRPFFCQLLKSESEFCAGVNDCNDDEKAYILKHADAIKDAWRSRVQDVLPEAPRLAIRRYIQQYTNMKDLFPRKKKGFKNLPEGAEDEEKKAKPVLELRAKPVLTLKAKPVLELKDPELLIKAVKKADKKAQAAASSSSSKDDFLEEVAAAVVKVLERKMPKASDVADAGVMTRVAELLHKATPEVIAKKVLKRMHGPDSPSLNDVVDTIEETQDIVRDAKAESDEAQTLMGVPPPPKHAPHLAMRRYVEDNFLQYKWGKVKMENLCGTVQKGGVWTQTAGAGASTILEFNNTQQFIRHYFTPENPLKGILLWHSMGSGKTCTAMATASSTFEKQGYTVLWVTRTTLKSDIWKNMFEQVCSVAIQDRIRQGLPVPEDSTERLRLLSKAWSIRPMSYKQFSNLVEKKNRFYADLVKKNGAEDPLRKTLLIIDEAHKLYGGTDLSGIERPDMDKLHEALMRSYEVSGKDSVRLMLMTATPITQDPMELMQLVNLCKPRKEQMPVDFEEFQQRYLDETGVDFDPEGSRAFLDDIAGHISYLNRERDARQFTQPHIEYVRVPMSTSEKDRERVAEMEEAIERETLHKDEMKQRFKAEAARIKEEYADTKDRCKKMSPEDKAICLLKAEKDYVKLLKAHKEAKKQHKEDLLELRNLIKTHKAMLSVLKVGVSQESIIMNKCVNEAAKPKEAKSVTAESMSKKQKQAAKLEKLEVKAAKASAKKKREAEKEEAEAEKLAQRLKKVEEKEAKLAAKKQKKK